MEHLKRVPKTNSVEEYPLAAGDECTPRQERFAQLWSACGNQAAAYRDAYDVSPKTSPGTVWATASMLANMPKVRARFKHYQEQAALETIMTVREALQWQIDVATADPNEIVRVMVFNCRNCYGDNYAHQWRNEAEFIEACAKAIDTNKPSPSEAGGYGFNPTGEPNPTCPHCYGAGIEHQFVADTTKLTGKAKRLYAGSKRDKFGRVEIKLHDQAAAWEKVCRMLGAFNDKLDLRTPAERQAATDKAKIPENLSVEDTTKAYLAMLSG